MISCRFPINNWHQSPESFCRNVDGLHQVAGSSADLVVEVHGSTQERPELGGIWVGCTVDLWMDLWWDLWPVSLGNMRFH